MKLLKFLTIMTILLVVLMGCESTYMRSGKMYFNLQKYDKAIEQYKLELQQNPNNAEAYKKLGMIYYGEKEEYLDAYNYFGKVIEINKANNKTDEEVDKFRKSCFVKTFTNANSLFKEKKYEEALEVLAIIDEMNYEAEKKLAKNTLKLKSYCYANLKNVEKENEVNIVIAEKFQDDVKSRSKLAFYYFSNEKYDDALKYFKEIAELVPEDANNQYNIGLVYNAQDKMEESKKYFEKTLALNPETDLKISVLEVLRNFAFNSKDYAKAIDYSKKLTEIKPENIEYVSFLCSILSNQKRFKDLVIYAAKWVELEPNNEDAKNLLRYAKSKQ